MIGAVSAEAIFAQLTPALDRSQGLSRADITRRQSVLVERLVRHAVAAVPFYRDSGRLGALFRHDGSFDMAGWRDVPILSRNEARSHEAALRAERVPADMGGVEASATSGSTGTPLRFRRTLVQTVISEVLLNRALRWHGRWPLVRVATIRGGAPTQVPTPNLFVLPGTHDFAGQVAELRDRRITHLIAAPSVGAALAEASEPGGLPDFTTFVATGEVLTQSQRRLLERRLGGKVINVYAASELGPLAVETPDGTLALSEESVLIDEPGLAATSEGLTQVVATPLYAFGMPLIRYAPGDYVRFASRGRDLQGLRRLSEVCGRQRNLFIRPDGSRFLPGHLVARRLQEILDHREWQLVQTGLTEIVLRMVVSSPPTPSQVSRLLAYAQSGFPGQGVSVEFVGSLATDRAGGKSFEQFLCALDDTDGRADRPTA